MVAGAAARCVAATAVSPIELLRTRLQFARRDEKASVVKDLIRGARQNPLDVTPYWRGLVPTLLRDVPFSSICECCRGFAFLFCLPRACWCSRSERLPRLAAGGDDAWHLSAARAALPVR